MSQPWAQNPGSWCQAGAGGSLCPDPSPRRQLGARIRLTAGGDAGNVSSCGEGVERRGLQSICLPAVPLLGLLSPPPHPWFSKDHPQLQRSPCSEGKYAVTHRLRGTWLYLVKACLMQQDWLLFRLGHPMFSEHPLT